MPGISDLTLKVNYWFVSHRQQFKRWWFVSLVAVNFLLLVFVVIALAFYLSDNKASVQSVANMPRQALSSTYKAAHQPIALALGSPKLLARGDGRYDIASRVDNNNTSWAAVVDFSYLVNNESVSTGTNYIAGNSTAYFIGLNISFTNEAKEEDINIRIDSIDWIFIPSQTGAVNASFLVSSTDKITTSDISESTVVKATVKNNAVVGWNEATVYIILTLADQVVGVNQFVVRQWESLVEKDLTWQWRKVFNPGVQVNILPTVNPFDTGLYIR